MIDLDKLTDIHIGGIDTSDYPDFVDAYLEAGNYIDRELTDDEIEYINDNERDWIYEKTIAQLY